jgi:hypothetical protein
MEPRPQYIIKISYCEKNQIGMPTLDRTRFCFIANEDEPVIIKVIDATRMGEGAIVTKNLELFALQDGRPHNITLICDGELTLNPLVLMVQMICGAKPK